MPDLHGQALECCEGQPAPVASAVESRLYGTCCLAISPVLNLSRRLGKAAWQSCLVSCLLSWLPKYPTCSASVRTAGLRAEPPRAAQGWGFIVKNDTLPDRSFNMQHVKYSGECKSVKCYLTLFWQVWLGSGGGAGWGFPVCKRHTCGLIPQSQCCLMPCEVASVRLLIAYFFV